MTWPALREKVSAGENASESEVIREGLGCIAILVLAEVVVIGGILSGGRDYEAVLAEPEEP